MRILFVGAVKFSAACLAHLFSMNAKVVGIIGSAQSENNSDFASLEPLAATHRVPYRAAGKLDAPDVLGWMRELKPDVIFCFGWSRLLGPEVLALPRHGVVGYHPALLPRNRGRHPLIWALALGLSETGSTFFMVDEGADSGPILSQRRVRIGDDDNATSLYDRIVETAIAQLMEMVPGLAANKISPVPQDKTRASYWRKRSAADGLIDWRMPDRGIHNLVRALATPYPGADVRRGDGFSKVWRTQVFEGAQPDIEPGRVIGVKGSTITVKSGIGAISLMDHGINPLPNVGDVLA